MSSKIYSSSDKGIIQGTSKGLLEGVQSIFQPFSKLTEDVMGGVGGIFQGLGGIGKGLGALFNPMTIILILAGLGIVLYLWK